jgi:hypothetical protein
VGADTATSPAGSGYRSKKQVKRATVPAPLHGIGAHLAGRHNQLTPASMAPDHSPQVLPDLVDPSQILINPRLPAGVADQFLIFRNYP